MLRRLFGYKLKMYWYSPDFTVSLVLNTRCINRFARSPGIDDELVIFSKFGTKPATYLGGWRAMSTPTARQRTLPLNILSSIVHFSLAHHLCRHMILIHQHTSHLWIIHCLCTKIPCIFKKYIFYVYELFV